MILRPMGASLSLMGMLFAAKLAFWLGAAVAGSAVAIVCGMRRRPTGHADHHEPVHDVPPAAPPPSAGLDDFVT